MHSALAPSAGILVLQGGEDVKQRFFDTFADQDKNALIVRLIEEAVRHAERESASRAAAERILARRATALPLATADFRRLRDAGRR